MIIEDVTSPNEESHELLSSRSWVSRIDELRAGTNVSVADVRDVRRTPSDGIDIEPQAGNWERNCGGLKAWWSRLYPAARCSQDDRS